MKKIIAILILIPGLAAAANGPIIKPNSSLKPGGTNGQLQYNNNGLLGGFAYYDGNNHIGIGLINPLYPLDIEYNGRGVNIGVYARNLDNDSNAVYIAANDLNHFVQFGFGSTNLGGDYQDNAFVVSNNNDLLLAPAGSSNRVKIETGNLAVGNAGNGLQIKEGSNARSGTFALASGSAWVANTSVTASSRILLTIQSKSGTSSGVGVTSVTVNAGFNAFGAATDNSTVAYFIVEGI